MSEAPTETTEYRVGRARTTVRFTNIDDAFRNIPLEGGVLYVFDSNTRPLVDAGLSNEIVLPAGEGHKNWESVSAVLGSALETGLGRDGVLVACGGGVLTDTAAFAASLYMRGCRVILIPTTLLGMVDAAFGGKTGIDFGGYKNIVGSFHPASELRIAVDFLSSLPERDFHSGLAEVLKHSLLVRSDLRVRLSGGREKILQRDLSLLRGIVADALSVKAKIVEEDFLEHGVRAHLNLGHTYGHALEAVTGFSEYTHGEAVAWGIDKAMKTGVLLGETDPGYAREVSELLSSFGFDLAGLPERAAEIVEAMHQDKKKRGGRVRHVVQRGWGETVVRPVEDALVLDVLKN